MRYEEKDRLTKQSKATHELLYFKNGISELFRKPIKNIFVIFYIVFTFFILNKKSIVYNLIEKLKFSDLLKILMNTIVVIFMLLLFIYIITKIGKPFGSSKIHDNLLRIGLTNQAGECPLLIGKYKNKNNILTMEFLNNGIPLIAFQDKLNQIETALNINIPKMQYGKNKRTIILHTLSANHSLPKVIPWKDSYVNNEDFILVLGESLLGQINVDLSSIPHILLGGASGSGKSMLLKLLLHQCMKKGSIVYIADFKGGVDFNTTWHNNCKMIFKENDLYNILIHLVDNLEERKVLFRESGVENIIKYNLLGHNLKRIVFACDEIAEVLDKTGLSKENKELVLQIENKLSVIARQGSGSMSILWTKI